jgi:hypothetical protein
MVFGEMGKSIKMGTPVYTLLTREMEVRKVEFPWTELLFVWAGTAMPDLSDSRVRRMILGWRGATW